jgi:hypothetical protein
MTTPQGKKQSEDLSDILLLAQDFLLNPYERETQLRVFDYARRYPFAWSLIMAQRYDVMLQSLGDYATMRRIDEGMRTFSKQEAIVLVQAIKKSELAEATAQLEKEKADKAEQDKIALEASKFVAPQEPIDLGLDDDEEEYEQEITALTPVIREASKHSTRQEKAIKASQALGLNLDDILEFE